MLQRKNYLYFPRMSAMDQKQFRTKAVSVSAMPMLTETWVISGELPPPVEASYISPKPTRLLLSCSNILILAIFISCSDHFNSFLNGYHYSLSPGILHTVARMYPVNTNLIMSLLFSGLTQLSSASSTGPEGQGSAHTCGHFPCLPSKMHPFSSMKPFPLP